MNLNIKHKLISLHIKHKNTLKTIHKNIYIYMYISSRQEQDDDHLWSGLDTMDGMDENLPAGTATGRRKTSPENRMAVANTDMNSMAICPTS